MEQLLESVGADADSEAVAYCGSGISACVVILAVVAAGRDEPLLYPGSFSEWSRNGHPVAR
jgi:thiosulfate/3-mercaptopyruvate sulfurtransferase